jgi:Uma2 family endonuclease
MSFLSDRVPNTPNLAVEVLSRRRGSAIDIEGKLDEYLTAGTPLVWLVHSDRRTIRVYRNDGATRLFGAQDMIENESMLPGFRVVVGELFSARPKNR